MAKSTNGSQNLSGPQRIFVFASSIAVWLFAFLIVNPWVKALHPPFYQIFSREIGQLLKHIFIYSTPTALLCFGWMAILFYFNLIPKIKFDISKKSLLQGTLWGLAIAAFTLAIAPLLGASFSFHFNPWTTAGNFFSNFAEEIIFRGLLFYALWTSSQNKFLAIALSGVIFGLSHQHYPWAFKGYIFIVGTVLSYITSKENNLIPAIWAHDIADWIVDLFL